MSRFDYVKYDEKAAKDQAIFKAACMDLDSLIDTLASSPYRSRAIKSIEECYMWIGKCLRDEQIQRNGSAELQEERKSDEIKTIKEIFGGEVILKVVGCNCGFPSGTHRSNCNFLWQSGKQSGAQ